MFFRWIPRDYQPQPGCFTLDTFQIPWITLRRAWLLSHICTALLFWSTFFVSTTTGATFIVALLGIPWAVTCWAPFALIAAEISQRHHNLRSEPEDGEREHSEQELGETVHGGHAYECPQAGVVLGIHNVAIAAPQVIATLVSWAIFRQMEKPRGSVGDESVAWVLRFGGVCALVAACLTRRVKEEKER
jgi:solute carrier family 45 protein 1/2/4